MPSCTIPGQRLNKMHGALFGVLQLRPASNRAWENDSDFFEAYVLAPMPVLNSWDIPIGGGRATLLLSVAIISIYAIVVG